ncbi:MAG: fibrobacter succinogenes major paralogous domain-containing protein, partial [Fibromonadaceae bacterium]|nr:fibrobacter succinogenes major paralogous domain-containing protein [Fibromonadaceae bacterium]
LYNWYAVNTGKLAPKGWHIPSDEEWKILADYLGGENVAGGKMKEAGTAHWLDPNTGATNSSGFTALPAGYRGKAGFIPSSVNSTLLWSSTEFNEADKSGGKYHGAAVRCVRD